MMELVKEDAEFQAFLAKNEMQEVVLRIEIDPATDSVSDAMATMTKAIGSLLAREGVEFPVHMALLGCNGSGHLCRYTLRADGSGADVSFLAEHNEAPGWMLPVHALMMDSNGYTARVIMTEKRKGN